MKTLSLLAILLLVGCASYQSKFDVAGNKFSLPKDASFNWLQVSIPTTNGTLSLVISNGVFKMNPAVIDAKTAHDVAIINATVQGIESVSAQAGKSMALP